MISNLARISELLEEEVESIPERSPTYRSDLVRAVEQLVVLQEEHRIERIDINIKYKAIFEELGRSFADAEMEED